jgi:TRAP-type mannitol/chloroaromatic compound transport system substrate-binding protein
MFKVKPKMQEIVNGGENMKREKLVLLVLAVMLAVSLVSLVVLPGCGPAAEEEQPQAYNLTIQSCFPHGDLGADSLHFFADSAHNLSGGRITIAVFAEPDIVPMVDCFDAVAKGTIDMTQCCGAFWGGILPVSEVEFGLPGQWIVPNGENMTLSQKAHEVYRFFHEDGFLNLLRTEYAKHGVYYLDVHTTGPVPILVSKVPIVTIEDMQGLKIRDEGIWTRYHNMLGAVGTEISGSDTYMALKLGTLDAAQWDTSCITGLKWYEVAPYWVHGEEFDVLPQHILVNMATWNSLPADMKTALEGAAYDYFEKTLQAYVEDLQKCYDLVTQGVLKESFMDANNLAIHQEKALELWAEKASEDPACAQALELVKKWRGLE